MRYTHLIRCNEKHLLWLVIVCNACGGLYTVRTRSSAGRSALLAVFAINGLRLNHTNVRALIPISPPECSPWISPFRAAVRALFPISAPRNEIYLGRTQDTNISGLVDQDLHCRVISGKREQDTNNSPNNSEVELFGRVICVLFTFS